MIFIYLIIQGKSKETGEKGRHRETPIGGRVIRNDFEVLLEKD
jgi:hypothetical protein